MTGDEEAKKKLQELLSAAHVLLQQARELSEQHGLQFTFGTMGWTPDDDDLPEEINVEWQPSGGYRCW